MTIDADHVDQPVLLAYAVEQMHNAIHALFSFRLTTIPGDTPRITRLESRYTEIADSIAGQQGTQNGAVARSMPPLWVDATDWLHRLDTQTRDWISATSATPTPERWLTQLDLQWRPQDTVILQRWTDTLERWTAQADQLLGNASTALPVRAACPACGRRWVYRKDNTGEWVRTDALSITRGVGCSCAGCRASWGESQYEFLARVLGCDALPGAELKDAEN